MSSAELTLWMLEDELTMKDREKAERMQAKGMKTARPRRRR